MSEIMLEVEGVNRYFNSGGERIQALQDINLAIETGTLTILKGPSGSGKTTLMNLLGALDKPDAGKIYFSDQEITGLPTGRRDQLRKKKIGFVFQSIALVGMMTAQENVEFGLKIADYQAQSIPERAQEVLQSVGLEDRKNHYPYELSGGEQQRVGVARAIAHQPEIVFADEPTGELDAPRAVQVIKMFKNMIAKLGITIVMTTHNPNLMQFADTVFSLKDGRLVE